VIRSAPRKIFHHNEDGIQRIKSINRKSHRAGPEMGRLVQSSAIGKRSSRK